MIYSVGHSNISEKKFLELVKPLDVILDIRSHPTSRHEQFRIESLQRSLGNRYEWEPRLGGWDIRHNNLLDEMATYGVDLSPYLKGFFPKKRINEEIEQKDKPIWYIRGFFDYQYFMTLPEFQDAAALLIERGQKEHIGILCCELKVWACHRSMVSDYLWFNGVDSTHLQPKRIQHSAMIGNRFERYDPAVIKVWNLWKGGDKNHL